MGLFFCVANTISGAVRIPLLSLQITRTGSRFLPWGCQPQDGSLQIAGPRTVFAYLKLVVFTSKNKSGVYIISIAMSRTAACPETPVISKNGSDEEALSNSNFLGDRQCGDVLYMGTDQYRESG